MAANFQIVHAGDRDPDLVEADSEQSSLTSTLDEFPRNPEDHFGEEPEDDEAFAEDAPMRTPVIFSIRAVVGTQYEHADDSTPRNVIVAWAGTGEENDAATDASEGTDTDNEVDIELDVDDEDLHSPARDAAAFCAPPPPARPRRAVARTAPDVLARVQAWQQPAAAPAGLAPLRGGRAFVRAGAAFGGRLPPIPPPIAPPIPPLALPAQHRSLARRHARLLQMAQRDVEEMRRSTDTPMLAEKMREVRSRPPASPDPYAGSHFAGGAVLSARQLRGVRGNDERGARGPTARATATAQEAEQEQMGGIPPRPTGARPANMPNRRMFGSVPTPRRRTP